jgi:hypothetical protein
MVLVALLFAGAACAYDEDLATTEQAVGSFNHVLLGMEPVGYWRLGDRDTTVLRDLGPNAFHGVYNQSLPTPDLGAIAGDPNTSVYFPKDGRWGEVANHKEFSLTRSWDDFLRACNTSGYPPMCVLAPSWGPAGGGSGDFWQAQVTTPGPLTSIRRARVARFSKGSRRRRC